MKKFRVIKMYRLLKNRIIAIMLALGIVLGYVYIPDLSFVKSDSEVFATTRKVIDSGSCGDNVTYTLYSDGELVISGTGAMYNYESSPF